MHGIDVQCKLSVRRSLQFAVCIYDSVEMKQICFGLSYTVHTLKLHSTLTLTLAVQVGKQFSRVGAVFDSDNDDGSGIQFRMMGTFDSLEGQAIVRKNLRAIDKQLRGEKWTDALLRLIALTFVSKDEQFW